MSHAIWRYPIEITDVQTVPMPAGALILAVARREGRKDDSPSGFVHDAVEMWALVDTSAHHVDRQFRVVGTGHPLNVDSDDLEYLGTVQIENGKFVFHVFEVSNS